MSAVDALDTMILMGLQEEADSTREFIARRLSFDQDITVKNFEITIRMLGGLLSSYQLSGDRRLLALAEDLGRRLLPAFASPTGMPYVNVNLRTGQVRDSLSNPADVEESYQAVITNYERAPHTSVEGMKRLQKLLTQLNPKIAEVRVETLIDSSFMNKLESSGFIQSVYKKN